MRAFNRDFIFHDEPTLSTPIDSSLETIHIRRDNQSTLSQLFRLQSPWVEMTQRAVRYYSNVPFEAAKKIDSWALEVDKVVTLIWQEETDTILYKEGEEYSPKLLQFWILHTFFPFVVSLADIYHVFHVSSVEVNNRVVLFSAFSGGGKSTLVDYFLQKGHTLYGDDTVAIEYVDNQYHIVPSYPFHRPFREAEVLGYPIKNFATERKALSYLYRLSRGDKEESVSLKELHGIKKFEAIYQSEYISFKERKVRSYHYAMEMAKHIKVFEMIIPWDKKRLEEVYQAILIHNGV